MPTINTVREKYYLKYKNEKPHPSFHHEPAASKPTEPAFPDGLTVPQRNAVKAWRQSRGAAKAALYAALTGDALTKADAYIAWDLLRSAWESADAAARQDQYAWFRADAAISNYDAVPQSGSNSGTGGGAPTVPQTKQEI